MQGFSSLHRPPLSHPFWIFHLITHSVHLIFHSPSTFHRSYSWSSSADISSREDTSFKINKGRREERGYICAKDCRTRWNIWGGRGGVRPCDLFTNVMMRFQCTETNRRLQEPVRAETWLALTAASDPVHFLLQSVSCEQAGVCGWTGRAFKGISLPNFFLFEVGLCAVLM